MFVALLRGINVSGQKKIKMADLRAVLEGVGLQNVQTYIQSGNVVFESKEQDKSKLEQLIFNTIQKQFGFEVPTLTLRAKEIDAIIKSNPFLGKEEENKLYFVLLKQKPSTDVTSEFNQLKYVHEDFQVSDNCVYLLCKNGYGNAKLNNNLIEKKLKVEATTRNLKTMQKLLEMTQTM
ncbi:DUF1697 domain-containing protein [Flagellimonas zhangzhouensis]|uniref:Uncharacterized conserved protein, DUF1697 family n=2 Tax=Flagellimonas zhangzhouensis TaxID=1073328 RepID=A0A1H2VKR8_9FLAO|nr:DUF1697 domain-containing protein [Allomuricauda zhangzhouensis]SDQ07446.1 Uncharacterized conserved protein, DUF1697 family [Allomuricauda zhangzhouensis]SDW68469.1 Uncharacterized conserved protein, DUF1697 family [Allomuricauda zhangzhouensis]